ncbi:DinB family protein [Algisphaera agarilytica]|uniref:DinB superfamily protein n=1 Tax=Algisphaera agarilytica TaxID=1385975 RepID=A0A7X0H3B6_9BACT|nr:DUF664 domain-containing protein [Algisphaera agarilytica]MBB6428450.1 hypothetical protein [Algisphaera agarilytica]
MQFQTDYPGAVAAFKGEACFTLDYSRDRLLHCLKQLDAEQIWQRPHPAMNAVGNIVLHVSGNLRQWITVGCDPMESMPDDRDRPAEFAAARDNPVASTPTELADHLRVAVDDAKDIIESLNKDNLLEPRNIQGFDVTGMGAVWHSVSHLEGHAQETIFATRLLLGDAYRFKDQY